MGQEERDDGSHSEGAALQPRRHFAMRKVLNSASSVSSVRKLVLWLLVVTSFDIWAQTAPTGALTGAGADPSDAVVQNARITLRNFVTEGTLTTLTGLQGM